MAAALRVHDLVRSPALQLRVLAGEAGLGRPVAWAHVSELEDPTPWLLGAELIMTTGIAVPRSAVRQRAYVERLHAAGVAALALSAHLHVPPLRQAFLAAAEERALPVLELPLQVPFIAVAQEVAAAAQADARKRLSAELQVFGALRWLAAEDLTAAELFRRLEGLSGYSLFLCTRHGSPLLPGVPVPGSRHAALLPDSPDPAPAVPGGYVLPVPAPGGPAGYLLALERRGGGAGRGARPAGLGVVQHIATVAALQLSMVRHERETLRRQGAETLAELVQEALDPQSARRHLSRLGFDARAPVLLAVVDGEGEGPPDDAAVVQALDGAAVPYLVLRRHEGLYVLLADSPPALDALAALPRIRAGVSRPFTAGGPLGVPRREACLALARARSAGRPLVTSGDCGDDTTDRWLHEDPSVLHALVDQVLGAALRYDTEHGGALVLSALTWLERDRSTEEAALALHIHPNTLLYRLRRFAALSGRNLSSTADLTEVWLALRAARSAGLLS
ncbi:PucR family transcriptional regulator ligand-binding domain-containing protein [Streptomyces ficellus]|uniref:PucR family transcriptional regulator ligand-binding domain-containing protein n=1 Tax=Streptomyces ficellus TaxID=1977088 RepID=A0ABT7ZDN9_9ACTN|nr:PucR family transcriptional regulator [Streptomyces ficellus]MDN3297622.1 PucR family transcriptional regulator ligand-binding domain-containing protein [Streptomyces ficellus]